MAYLGLCDDEPVKTLRNIFGANVVRVPEERIKPVCVVAASSGKTSFRGELIHLLKGSGLDLKPKDYVSSQMSDLSGSRSRSVNLKLGLEIMDGFLKGFGIPSAGISTHLQRATKVSFSFKDVARTYVDINWLGRVLNGKVIDDQNPAANIFINDYYKFLVIDSVIGSSDFSISVEESSEQGFKLNLPAIQTFVAQANAEVSVSSTTGLDLTFQGNKRLTFAFSCVRLFLEEDGSIASIEPAFKNYLLGKQRLNDEPDIQPTLYSPDRVLLTEAPSMLMWDD